jgi:hypothetical protein
MVRNPPAVLMRRVEAARYEYRFAIVVFTYVMEQKCSYCPEAERTFGRPPLMGQVIAEPGWSLLSAQAKMLLIQAIRSVMPPGGGAGGPRLWRGDADPRFEPVR